MRKIGSRWMVLSFAALAGAGGTAAWASSSPTPVPVSVAVAWWYGGDYEGREGVEMQRGESDCGIAALAMVMKHHRRRAELEGERRGVLKRGEGLSLLEMQGIAARHGLAAKGWRMDLPALARAPLPAVAHFEDHYVVVDRVLPDGTVHVRDPGVGRVVLSAADFARLWTGNVLVFGS
ncbi:MAG TPA: cysteine peptidase family C39 domain-containing protein [Longimicrobium sp.]